MIRKTGSLLCALVLFTCSPNLYSAQKSDTAREKVRTYFNRLVADSGAHGAELRMFLNLMPKGGDLHQHFTGTTYAETYLDFIKKENSWISKKDFSVITPRDTAKLPDTLSVDKLRSDNKMLSDFSMVWSDKDFSNHYHDQNAPDVQFFGTFANFSTILKYDGALYTEGLKILKNRAKLENVQYIEQMFISPGYKRKDARFDDLCRKSIADKNIPELHRTFQDFVSVVRADALYQKAVPGYLKQVKTCADAVNDESFTLRFQSYVSRNDSPAEVFSALYTAFCEADTSDLVVGVNIVNAENSPVAMSDYSLHMQMFRYMKELFPGVKTAMHAGELTIGMVRPEDLTFHINEAVMVALADRIGHGVDIGYEVNAPELLAYMREKKIPVEINLTSNEFILGVKDGQHPFRLYLDQGVPVVLTSDDEGVSRNNLTDDYLHMVQRYGITYDSLREIAGNSIRYSFLKESEKSQQLVNLDKRFAEFEARMARMIANASREGGKKRTTNR
ncbi:MAG: adenosine deaminase [Chlorobiaceae bacterium]|nr:adenosine deaminase [Chlorobiaceae bacterium]